MKDHCLKTGCWWEPGINVMSMPPSLVPATEDSRVPCSLADASIQVALDRLSLHTEVRNALKAFPDSQTLPSDAVQ